MPRKPKPIALQIAEGDPRKRGVNKLQEAASKLPKATRGLPGCPRHLSGRARYAWTFWAAELQAMGLDRRPDAMMLEGACIAYEKMTRAHEKLTKEGEVVNTPVMNSEDEVVGFTQKKNLWVSIQERAMLLLKGFCSEFGLTPVSRERITIDKPDEGEVDLAELLSRPRAPRKPITTVN